MRCLGVHCEEASAACAASRVVCPSGHRAPAAPCALRPHAALLVRPC